ncbi:MAG: prephenate dehydratase [Epulopiscium sp.]|nr:prephenate dehydratase [Candidatus Epulonipiscium sp.]
MDNIDEVVGYLGPKGTFSQQAALMYTEEKNLKAFSTIADVLEAVDCGHIQKGIVPIENSIEGAVNMTLDMMVFDVDVKLQKEIVIPVEHHLFAQPGIKLAEIEKVFSHPQALGQCRKFLHQYLPDVPIFFSSSTAEAVKQVSESKEKWAAIGTRLAGEIYGVEMIQSHIQDEMMNETLFIVVGKEDAAQGIKCKTSFVFSTKETHKPGELYKVLSILALWDINMTKIVSRPAKNKLGQYVFCLDVEGHREEEDLKEALRMVERKTSFLKILGSYEIFE